MTNGDRGVKKKSLDSPLWHKNDQQGFMILTQSLKNSVPFSTPPFKSHLLLSHFKGTKAPK